MFDATRSCADRYYPVPNPLTARLTVLATAIVCWSLAASVAHAQPLGKTVVVPYLVGETGGPAFDMAKQADAALGAKRTSLISLHDARDRFTALSREPQIAPLSDIDALAKEAHVAIEHVAFGRTAAAHRSVRQIVELAERSLETMNRETANARTLLDACLSLVRASLHDNKRDDAIEQAMRCRQLVPDLAPSEVSHPAVVVGALAEADDQLRRMRVGSLNVRVQPERACEVYLNGRHLGNTPFFLERAPVGEYRVQVECGGGPGRVHFVHLGDETAQLTVNSAFDDAVQTDSRLALRYSTSDLARASLVAHATLAGRDVRAEDVVLVGVLDSQAVLLRVQVRHERLVAGASLPLNAPASAYAQALEQLGEARFFGINAEDFRVREVPAKQNGTATAPAEPPPTSAPPARQQEVATEAATVSETKRGMLWAGLITLALGAASEIGAWYAYNVRVTRAEELANSLPDEYEDARQNWMDARGPLLGASIVGTVLTTTGVELTTFAVPDKHVPWWLAGTAAGFGVGLASWGLVDVVQGKCTNQDARMCAIEAQQRERGTLVLMTSIGLLALPITKLSRGARTDRTALRITSMATGLAVSGRW